MTILQLVVRGSSPTSSEALNVWHFSGAVTPATAMAQLRNVYLAMRPVLADDGVFNVDPVGRLLDEATGTLEGFVAASWSATVNGTGVGVRGPDATAVLVAWETGVIVGGRPIRGRTFFPYPSVTVLGEGQVTGGGITALDAAVANAVPAAVAAGAGIWRRPVSGGGGAFSLITTGAGRREYSYQGRRRN